MRRSKNLKFLNGKFHMLSIESETFIEHDFVLDMLLSEAYIHAFLHTVDGVILRGAFVSGVHHSGLNYVKIEATTPFGRWNMDFIVINTVQAVTWTNSLPKTLKLEDVAHVEVLGVQVDRIYFEPAESAVTPHVTWLSELGLVLFLEKVGEIKFAARADSPFKGMKAEYVPDPDGLIGYVKLEDGTVIATQGSGHNYTFPVEDMFVPLTSPQFGLWMKCTREDMPVPTSENTPVH
jgi:hypothetical protein